MTVGQLPEGISASSSVVKPFTNNNSSNSDQQIRPNQNQTNYSPSENSFTSSSSSSEILEQQCEEQKMQKICHKAATTIGKSSRFARFLADGVLSRNSSESCSHQITSSPTSTLSSLPVRPLKSYHHPTGHWEYGMILVVLFLLSTFSTSSMVACVPLGQSGGGGGGRDGALPSSSSSSMEEGGGLMSASRILELKPQNQNQQSDSSISYSVQPKGQLYLPSLLSKNPQNYNGRGREAVGEERGNHNNEEQQQQSRTTSHFLQRFHHPDQSTFNTGENHFQRAPIQKQNQDLVRGVIDEAENELESGGGDDDPLSPALGVDGDSDDSEWETVIDPHLYVLTEWNTQPYHEQFPLLQQQRKRRNSGMGPSLSIVNPLDVLRQRLLLEIARRKMRQSHNQIIANEEILRKIGRRR